MEIFHRPGSIGIYFKALGSAKTMFLRFGDGAACKSIASLYAGTSIDGIPLGGLSRAVLVFELVVVRAMGPLAVVPVKYSSSTRSRGSGNLKAMVSSSAPVVFRSSLVLHPHPW